MNPFERLESRVRSYSRAFPAVFDKAEGAFLYDEHGRKYIDFFAGAGVMNYGHNNPEINQAVIEYIRNKGILHSLDMFTSAKGAFLEAFEKIILRPRNLDYRIQFCGPTGTNAVEAAFKLARLVKQKRGVIAFTHGYHGMSMGALAATANSYYRSEFFPDDLNVTFMPYCGYLGPQVDTAQVLRKCLSDSSSGVRVPAAIILETIQAEGGINVATDDWLRAIEKICRDFGIVLIVDEIQVGNGRSGDFFGFERAGIRPDIVVVSKAIGAGMPMAILLIRPDFDVWDPGKHTGTFRGNNLSFVGGVKAMERYWRTNEFSDQIKEKGEYLSGLLEVIQSDHPQLVSEVRGRGLIRGLVIPREGFCSKISREAFNRGLVIELAGANDEVLKFLPPLVVERSTIKEGVQVVTQVIADLA